MQIRLSLLEIFLLEVIVWLILWLTNDYVATLLTIILVAVVLAVLVIALMAEWVERSRVPRKYFYVMAISVLAPVLTAIVYVALLGGKLDFLDGLR